MNAYRFDNVVVKGQNLGSIYIAAPTPNDAWYKLVEKMCSGHGSIGNGELTHHMGIRVGTYI